MAELNGGEAESTHFYNVDFRSCGLLFGVYAPRRASTAAIRQVFADTLLNFAHLH
jgi:hypothetical protein